MRHALGLAALVLGLAGCGASLPGLPGLTGAASARVESGLPLGEVPAQRPVSGQCALALWTRGAPATRVLLATDNPAVAHVTVEGRSVRLTRAEMRGAPAFGHYPEQTWRGDGLTLVLTGALVPREGMVGGVVVEDATLNYTDAEGSDVIIPVGGLVACQS